MMKPRAWRSSVPKRTVLALRRAQRIRRSAPALLLLLGFGLTGFACGDDDQDTPTTVLGPACVEIASLWPRGRDKLDVPPESPCDPSVRARELAGETPVTIGCDRRLGVGISRENFGLRPLGACGATPQCGYVYAELRNEETAAVVTSAETAAEELLLSVPEIIAGRYVLHVELRPVSTDARTQAELTVTVAVEDACTAPSSGGAGGEAGSGSGGTAASGGTGMGGMEAGGSGGEAGSGDAGSAGDPAGASGQGGAGGGDAGGSGTAGAADDGGASGAPGAAGADSAGTGG